MTNFDVIIIGAGIVGSLTARELSRYSLKILLIDMASDICTGATSANSAIVHGGYAAHPGTLKAEMNARSIMMWDELAEELEFAFSRCGTYVVAVGEEEFAGLEALRIQGDANGIPTEIISGEDMRKREPSLNDDVSGALYCPVGGICDPWGATIAAAENAVTNGVTLKLETAFEDFLWDENSDMPRITGIRTNQGDFTARWVINAAGINSDVVMHKANVHSEFKITPRRGEYFIMDRNRVQINNVLFPMPTKVSKGILVTTTLHGNTIIGPNAEDIEDRYDTSVTAAGMGEVWEGARKLVPGLQRRDVIATFAGLRPGGNAATLNPDVKYDRDFIIEIPDSVSGLVNLGGIESPGLTAAPAIAVRVTEMLRAAGENLTQNPDFNPHRPARPVFRHLNREEQAALIEKDARYGRIICRCENVTEGEIVAEIHAPIPATSYDAIKRRTWLGTGRCQGGFDMPRVTEILARELGVSVMDITKSGGDSEFLYRRTKEPETEVQA